MKVICSEPMKKWCCGFGCCFDDGLCVCVCFITQMWPILSNTCTKYQADGRVMERCC